VRILIGADSFRPDVNGAARFTAQLAEGLAARGHDVHVVCASTDGREQTVREGQLTLHRLHSIRYRMHESLRICLPWQTLPRTRELIAELRPDVVHIQSHMVIGRGLAYAAEQLGVPLVATNHFMPENVFGYIPLLPQRLHGSAGRMAWRDLAKVFGAADRITAPTPRAVELLRDATGLDGEAISCGIDSARYRKAAEAVQPEGPPVILFVGRLDPEKRVQELITSFAMLSADTGVRLEIVGDGDQRAELTAQAARLGIAGRVDFRGRIDDAALLDAYARASVFCMPGIAELQSIVTLEAMSAGKPVVAANAMALPHLVGSGRNGWLYSPGDVGELTLRLATLVADPQLRRRMGQASLQIVSGHDVGATLDRFEQIYTELSVRTGRPSTAALSSVA
jgi:phosphatidylinositol alpha 1,6-mannosyltransferase